MKIRNIFAIVLLCIPLISLACEEADYTPHYLTANESIVFRIDKFYLQDHFQAICTTKIWNDFENEDTSLRKPYKMKVRTSNYNPRDSVIEYITPSIKTSSEGGIAYIFGENGIMRTRRLKYMYVTFTVLPTEENPHPFIRIKCQN